MGVIFILTNQNIPNCVKIGYATDIERRIKQINSSAAMATEYRVYATYETNNELADIELHKLIEMFRPGLRINERGSNREYFAMSPEDAYSILESIAKISGTERNLKKEECESQF